MSPEAPKESGVEAGDDGVVVSTEWLAARLADPRVRVVDIRGKVLPVSARPEGERTQTPTVSASPEGERTQTPTVSASPEGERTQTPRAGWKPRYVPKREDYDASHIPGAVFVDWTRDIVDPLDSVPAQIAQPQAFASVMGAIGVDDATLVVAYDDYDHIFAGRLAWALRYYGHDAVRVLDGGWTRWVAEARPTTREVPSPLAATFTARPRHALRRTADDVARILSAPDALLIDARPPDQFSGAASAARRAGHIPGARNVHYAKLVDPKTGRFLPGPELARIFAEAGVDVTRLPREIVVYCNGGGSCTVPLNALRMLGRDDVAVYDGSWNEWGNDDSRPLRSGLTP